MSLPALAPATSQTLIRIESLSVRYGTTVALRDVSLDVPAQRISAIIGPSGCGKSSLLSAINRLSDLVPSCRVEGDITIHGVPVRGRDVDVQDLRRRVGMIFQKPNPFPLSIRRNVDMALRERWHRDELDERVECALRDVGLWVELRDRLDAPALALSGGQQQRLCIARALALEPEVILMDEPCSALDPISSAVVEELIAGLAERCTVVVVTHNLAQARRISDEVAFFWMRDGAGALIESGPSARVFESPGDPLTEAYLRGMRG